MKQTERLFLLDGMGLVYRAYYSFAGRPLRNSNGENTSAAYGFASTLMKILDDERPDHVAVVFDTKEPTFRHELFPEYKATRDAMPEDMVPQLGWIKDIVRALQAPLLELPGFEADDIIGTLARAAEREGIETYIVTADKDMMQLISSKITMLRPSKVATELEVVQAEGVRAKFGVAPGQVIDVLALTGDASDNVPGVKGIGEKTAIPLIQQWHSLENLYEHVQEVPQKGVREKLIAHKATAFLSKTLVTIDTAVPIALGVHDLRAQQPDADRLRAIFTQLEFKALLGRIGGKGAKPEEDTPARIAADAPSAPAASEDQTPVTTISEDQHTYHCVTTPAALKSLCTRLKKASSFAFDTETTSTDAMQAALVGCSFCVEPREAWYVPVLQAATAATPTDLFGASQHTDAPASPGPGLPLGDVITALKPILEDPRKKIIGQNAKYDMLVMRNHGIVMHPPAFDTMVAGYLLRADGQHSLDSLALETFHYRMVSFDDLTGTGKNRVPITEVPVAQVAEYAAEDADFTLRLCEAQEPRLKQEELITLATSIEFPLIAVLASMEFEGVRLNVEHLATMSTEIEKLVTALVATIHGHAGAPFNINSTQQLGEILFQQLRLPAVKKTKTGYSTDVSVLEGLQGQHPIIDALLEYRQLTKLKSTYVDALPALLHPRTGRLHTSFNQAVAATGRLSSSDPNLQNIPVRTDLGREIRRAFIPRDEGWNILAADYSQIELRVMAHISGDPGLREAFINDEDIHATTAARVFGVAPKDVSRDMRRKAKEVNFGIMYGIGPFGLANRLGITQTEAKEIIARYFDRFPGVKQYIQDTLEQARSRGFVQTLHGRRRYLPEITSRNQNIRGNAERQAINMPIQGTAADMIKIAMVNLHAALVAGRHATRLLLQVHDELICEVPEQETAAMKKLVPEIMANAMPLAVPVKVDAGFGPNWLEAK
ncbi:MAG: DNA polymerase I [Ignavibacteriae bacterium]|nr:DNA polymerase I [Ignavibacteriota bacterium]